MLKIIRNLLFIIITLLCLVTINYLKNIIIKRNNIYQEIIKNKAKYEYDPIEGRIINNKYFIPGINGRKVNINKSYNKMKKSGYYKSNHFVYDQVFPKYRLKDNKLPILRANSYYQGIAIISYYQIESLTSYQEYQNYPYILNVIFLNNSNYLILKNSIQYGDIIYLDRSLSYDQTKYLVSFYKSKGFKILSLKDLLSE